MKEKYSADSIKKQQFYFINNVYDFSANTSKKRLILMLPGKGCEWAKKSGGCTMCALSQTAAEYGKSLSSQDLIDLYDLADKATRPDEPSGLSIYNGGSFLNESEIPLSCQIELCKKTGKHPFFNDMMIESRVEYINLDRIKTLKEFLGEKKLTVGIGLESSDDYVRNVLIKKGLQKKDFETVIKNLKEINIGALVYVFLKPVGLTEKQAYDDTLRTIEYAFKVGASEVALEVAFIQKGTLMEKMYNEKKYNLPWLWTAIEIIKNARHMGPVTLGGFSDEPPPIAVAESCFRCSKKLNEHIQRYRQNNNIEELNSLECVCKKEWEKEFN